MKKRKYLMFIVFFTVFLQGPEISAATNDGQLVLDPNIITNSGGGIGTTGDFPVRNQLFTDEMTQRVKNSKQEQLKIPDTKASLTFSKQTQKGLYTEETVSLVKKLFVNYQPVVIPSKTEQTGRSNTLWYWIICAAGFPLCFLAVYLGRKSGHRRARKRKEKATLRIQKGERE
ncbi:type VII secretion protein EssA [Lactovum odontotermitis]